MMSLGGDGRWAGRFDALKGLKARLEMFLAS